MIYLENEIPKTTRKKNFSYIDIYGRRLSISSNKGKNIRFTLYHSNISEGYERKEFEYMTILLNESHIISPLTELYERVGNVFVGSADPIRDGKNSIILEKNEEQEGYYLTFCRDLGNELNVKTETNVALTDKPFYEFFDALTEDVVSIDNGIQYTKKLTH